MNQELYITMDREANSMTENLSFLYRDSIDIILMVDQVS